MNPILNNLTEENFQNLLKSYEISYDIFWDEEKKKLVHPAEYGTYREDLFIDFLRLYIPPKYGISTGFIIDKEGNISTQCDIIIYDYYNMPKIQNSQNQRFFLIEMVLGVIEMKSTIQSIGELNSILTKLANFKKIRNFSKLTSVYNRRYSGSVINNHTIPFDNIFTILVCYKFDFDFNKDDIDYKEIEQKYHHNMVLSLIDGLLSYEANNLARNIGIPFMNENLSKWFLKSNDSRPPHFVRVFLSQIFLLLHNATTFEIDMGIYLCENPGRNVL